MPEFSVAEAKETIFKLGSKVEEFKTLVTERDKEIKKLGEASAATEEKIAKLEEQVVAAEAAKERLDKLETAEKRRAEITAKLEEEAGGFVDADKLTEDQKAYKAACLKMLRSGIAEGKETEELRALEQKALSVQSDPDGGYYVTPDMNGRMVQRIFETSPIRAYASTQVIGTDALEGSVDDDEAGFEWVGETDQRNDETTPRSRKWRIPVHEMATRPRATQKLLEDSNVNVEQWLMSKIADKFARGQNAAFVNGDGVTKPRGFLTYDAAADPDVYEYGKIGRVVSENVGDITFDDLINLQYTLKGDYRNRATWAWTRKTFSVVRKLKDNEGQYLWQPGLQIGQPATVLGNPIAEFNDMPNVAAGALAVAFADWSLAYQIVDRLGMAVLRDPYTAKPFVEFYTRARVGGDVVNFDAIKLLEVDQA